MCIRDRYISWDILITIACAFAISRAMVNSGVADVIAHGIIDMSDDYGPHVLLAVLFIITNLFTELITNNAAAALAFPLALSHGRGLRQKVAVYLRPPGKQRGAPQLLREEPFCPFGCQIRHEQLHE